MNCWHVGIYTGVITSRKAIHRLIFQNKSSNFGGGYFQTKKPCTKIPGLGLSTKIWTSQQTKLTVSIYGSKIYSRLKKAHISAPVVSQGLKRSPKMAQKACGRELGTSYHMTLDTSVTETTALRKRLATNQIPSPTRMRGDLLVQFRNRAVHGSLCYPVPTGGAISRTLSIDMQGAPLKPAHEVCQILFPATVCPDDID